MRESELQKLIQLAESRRGNRLWRNNVGATYDQAGNFIRYGLANESTSINRQIKSGDLIGITPIIITPAMIGYTVGIFTSIEVKRPGWVYRGTPRETAQRAWNELVASMGGRAGFMSQIP